MIGNKAQVDRLMEWLNTWASNHTSKAAGNQIGRNKGTNGNNAHSHSHSPCAMLPPAPSSSKVSWKKGADPSSFKAVLISGPPGIGKTSSASLVANACGYDVVELNASDTRSKTR